MSNTCLLGTQCWVFFMITFSELILSLKFGLDLFSHTQLSMMGVWLVCIVGVSCAGVWLSHLIYKWRHNSTDDVQPDNTQQPVTHDIGNRIPYGLRKRAAHQRAKTDS